MLFLAAHEEGYVTSRTSPMPDTNTSVDDSNTHSKMDTNYHCPVAPVKLERVDGIFGLLVANVLLQSASPASTVPDTYV